LDVFFYAFFFTANEHLWPTKFDRAYLNVLWSLLIAAIVIGKFNAKYLLLITTILVISLIPLAHFTGGFTPFTSVTPAILKYIFYLALLWAFFTHLVITILWLFKLHDFHIHPAIWIIPICIICVINPAFFWSAFGHAHWANNYENQMGLVSAFAAHMIITGTHILIVPAMFGLFVSSFPQRYIKNIVALSALIFWYFVFRYWGSDILGAFLAPFSRRSIISF